MSDKYIFKVKKSCGAGGPSQTICFACGIDWQLQLTKNNKKMYFLLI